MTNADEQATEALRPAVDEASAERRRKRVSHRRRVRWAKRIAVGLVALAGVAALARALMPTAVPVDLAEARRGELDVYLEEDGRTRVRERYVVSAPVTGELVRVEVEPGTGVAEGEVLAQIVQPPAQLLDQRGQAETEARLAAALATERQAGAAIRRASAAAELARREAARFRALAGQGVAAAADRDRADTQAEVAEHDLAAARLASQVAAADVRMVRAAARCGAASRRSSISARRLPARCCASSARAPAPSPPAPPSWRSETRGRSRPSSTSCRARP
jgi:HlyD family secretion protein